MSSPAAAIAVDRRQLLPTSPPEEDQSGAILLTDPPTRNTGESDNPSPSPKAADTAKETLSGESTNTTTAIGKSNKVHARIIRKERKAKSETMSDTTDTTDSESSDVEWNTKFPVDLYCKKTGESHAVLTSFGFWNCPKCEQSLERPLLDKQKKDEKNKSSGVETQTTQRGPDNFSYLVRYADENRIPIYSEQWKGPFDLDEARKSVFSQITTKPIIRVETVLETSITASNHRSYYDVERIKKDGILDNPLVDVGVFRTVITVLSPAIIHVIRKLVSYYPLQDLQGKALDIGRHYDLVWLHLDAFEGYLAQQDKENDATDAKAHLRQLLAFVESMNGQAVADEKLRHTRGMCTYDMLWLLYKPGITIYMESYGSLAAFVVVQCKYEDARIVEAMVNRLVVSPRGWRILLWNLDYNGSYVGRSPREIYLPPFEGERKITDLNIIPAKHKDEEDGGNLREGLIKDGKRWFELLRGKQVSYSGHLLEERNREFHGRVYVDSASYYNIGSASLVDDTDDDDDDTTDSEYGGTKRRKKKKKKASRVGVLHRPPVLGNLDDMGLGLARCPCEECHGYRPHPPLGFPWTHYDLLNPHKLKVSDLRLSGNAADPDHRYLLCNRRLFGFDLKSRNWLRLDVRFCKELKRNTTAINTLVLQEETKNMIKALIQKYSGDSQGPGAPATAWRADHIENKGEGQIFLLHGSPGVGKTFTAECIAEYTGRPLLSLTCADIGTEDVSMEKKLLKWFQLAEKWGAVMLIDEADVFLEKRITSDIKRNSLVSGMAALLLSQDIHYDTFRA